MAQKCLTHTYIQHGTYVPTHTHTYHDTYVPTNIHIHTPWQCVPTHLHTQMPWQYVALHMHTYTHHGTYVPIHTHIQRHTSTDTKYICGKKDKNLDILLLVFFPFLFF